MVLGQRGLTAQVAEGVFLALVLLLVGIEVGSCQVAGTLGGREGQRHLHIAVYQLTVQQLLVGSAAVFDDVALRLLSSEEVEAVYRTLYVFLVVTLCLLARVFQTVEGFLRDDDFAVRLAGEELHVGSTLLGVQHLRHGVEGTSILVDGRIIAAGNHLHQGGVRHGLNLVRLRMTVVTQHLHGVVGHVFAFLIETLHMECGIFDNVFFALVAILAEDAQVEDVVALHQSRAEHIEDGQLPTLVLVHEDVRLQLQLVEVLTEPHAVLQLRAVQLQLALVATVVVH